MLGYSVVDIVLVFLVVTFIIYKLNSTKVSKFVPSLIFIGILTVFSRVMGYELLGMLSLFLLVLLPIVVVVLLRDDLYTIFVTKKERKKRVKEGGKQDNLSEEVLAGFSKGIIRSANDNNGLIAVFNKGMDLSTYAETGVDIGALKVSDKGVYSIFSKDSELNEGAVIIEDEYITHANVRLPKTSNSKVVDTYYDNNRHLSAFGLLEREDVVIVLVSAETGYIRVFYRGKDGKLNIDTLTTLENSVSGVMSVGYIDLKRLLQRMLNIKVDSTGSKGSKGKKVKKEKKVKEKKERKKETKEERKARRERERAERKK